ncbi:MAG: ATP-dependent Clp protease ATP-binding subunit [Chlamydiia bacterium]|nr:ATP-dependent Clp protease ATP-binding subunit [Chlamydiia bacterium]
MDNNATPSDTPENLSNIFSQLTHRAKNAIKHAKKFAILLNHDHLSPIHILYGVTKILDSNNYAFLKTNQITTDNIHDFTKDLKFNALSDKFPILSLESKDLISKSKEIAESFSHGYVATEHILMALLNIKDINVDAFLVKYKVDATIIIQQTAKAIKILNDSTVYTPHNISQTQGNVLEFGSYDKYEQGPQKRQPTFNEKLEILKSCGQDLTELARNNKLDKIAGRESEITKLMSILIRRKKNNPLLKGPSGVGKTAIAEGLAQAIVNNEVPEELRNKHVISLEMPSLVAGTKYRGQFEEKIKSIIEAAQDPNIILVIDEIHTIVGAGSAEGAIDAGNILKPALAKGLKCIGATTDEEFKKTIEKDGALARRFSIIKVDEPSELETLEILKILKPEMEKHHGCKYTDEALQAIPRLSNRYITDRNMPDKAIDVMDEAGSHVRIQAYGSKSVAISLESELKSLQSQKVRAIEIQNYQLAVELREKEKTVRAQISEIKNDSNTSKEVKRITPQIIAKVVAGITGILHTSITSSEAQKLSKLKHTLQKLIFGQEHAIEKICNAIVRSKLGLQDPKRPSSFLFLGPTGVGKTQLANTIAESIFDNPNSLIRIDMSEYMEKFSVSRILGSPPGYVGHDDTKTIADRVKKQPYSIVLFDEVEKAHPDVLDIMLQILENGCLTDSLGRIIDFSNAIIILTSNMGSKYFYEHGIGFTQTLDGGSSLVNANKHERITTQVLAAASKQLRPELMNRFDAVIVFKSLSKDIMKFIADVELQKVKERLKEQFKKNIQIDDTVVEFLAEKGFDPKYGARSVRRIVQDELTTELSGFLIAKNSTKHKNLVASLVDGKIQIQPSTGPVIKPKLSEELQDEILQVAENNIKNKKSTPKESK